jgi:hypothetical protein
MTNTPARELVPPRSVIRDALPSPESVRRIEGCRPAGAKAADENLAVRSLEYFSNVIRNIFMNNE